MQCEKILGAAKYRKPIRDCCFRAVHAALEGGSEGDFYLRNLKSRHKSKQNPIECQRFCIFYYKKNPPPENLTVENQRLVHVFVRNNLTLSLTENEHFRQSHIAQIGVQIAVNIRSRYFFAAATTLIITAIRLL